MSVWLGGYANDSFLDVRNWGLGHLPRTTEDVTFDGNASSRNCVNLEPATYLVEEEGGWIPDNTPYKSISLINSYSGHVILNNGLLVDDLILTSGAIDQPYGNARDITVQSEFNWTGGTLNSTTTGASLNLIGGSTATIAPGAGNTVTLGSQLRLLDPVEGQTTGATATFFSGIVGLKNGAGIEVGNLCVARIAPAQNVRMEKVNFTPGLITIQAGGYFIVEGVYDVERGLVNNGGKLAVLASVENGVVSEAVARFEGSVSNAQGAATIESSHGTVVVTRHAALKADKNIVLSYGTFDTGNVAGGYAQTGVSLIETPKLVMNGTDISYTSANRKLGNTLIFETILVTGDVEWNFGSFNPYISGRGDDNNCDLWKSQGKFTINTQICDPPTIYAKAINAAGNVVVATTLQETFWMVIWSDTQIVADIDSLPVSGIGGLNVEFNPTLNNKYISLKRPAT